MDSIKDIRARIKSIQKTQQITRTMQMVSASRLKKADNLLKQVRPYYVAMLTFLNHMLSDSQPFSSPLLECREEKRRLVILLSSERGLCGAFNSNMFSEADRFLGQFDKDTVDIVTIGKKGFEYLRKKDYNIVHNFPAEIYSENSPVVEQLTELAVNEYIQQHVDAVYVIYSKFESALRNSPTVTKLLNMEVDNINTEDEKKVDYIFEPGKSEIFNSFLPRFLKLNIYQTMIETVTAENASRMMAMKTATDNASELVDNLTLKMNKARQAVITNEILEIVTAGEALNG